MGVREQASPVVQLPSLHAVQVQHGEDDGHQEDDSTAHAHADVEHACGGGGGRHAVYWGQGSEVRLLQDGVEGVCVVVCMCVPGQ